MKKSISLKLFIITSMFFLILIGGTMISQSLFFERFYINKKMSNLENNIKEFKIFYSYSANDNISLSKGMQDFEQNNNAKIAIFSPKGELKVLPSIENEADPTVIKLLNDIFKKLYLNPQYTEAITKNGKILTTTTENNEFNIKNIVCIAPISLNNEFDNIIIAISPFQTIKEASSVIKEFYSYAFIAAIIVIIILALIYSNIISKPLISINKSAMKMAKLDFSEKCIINRSDEIGNLANTLNFLSFNLQKSLTELKDSNEKLKEDIEKERALEKMRKDFIAGVSHELKTPISLIEGYAEGLKDNIVSEESKDFYIEVIMDEAQKMSTLVSDMLELSRLESQTFQLKLSNFELKNLLINTSKKFFTFLEEKNLSLENDLIEDIVVSADKFRVEQVITNFLSNAIRHTTENGFIKMSMLYGKDVKYKGLPSKYNSKEVIFIEIENQGEHIPEIEMKNIWDKFYKIDKSRNRALGGTGLGLTIVKNILELHESVYGVENTKAGVKFYFSLNITN